tara:strand:- start:350 stop:712 length:363 start_codon:yes stop_codon:yes gene_type:complete
MAKNIQNKQKPTKKEVFLKALTANMGHISNACTSANIHRATYYSWISKDEDFKQSCDNVSEELLDLAEHKLLEKIKDDKCPQQMTAIIFFLKTKGKKRGYDERHQIELTKPFDRIELEGI